MAADESNGLYRVCVRPPRDPFHDLCLISLPHPRVYPRVLRVLRVLRLGSVKIGPNPEVQPHHMVSAALRLPRIPTCFPHHPHKIFLEKFRKSTKNSPNLLLVGSDVLLSF